MRDDDSRSSTELAVSSLLRQGLAELGLAEAPARVDQLTRLVSLLSHWAQRINLTGHRDPLELTSRLVLDAASLCSCLPELETASTLADLGSGAGFPGLPIAILNPDLEVLLVESRLKRNHFQREVRRRLGLARVRPILGRSDQLAPESCDIVVAQAMTQPDQALELMLPWARTGGLIVLPASQTASQPMLPDALLQLEERSYRVPGTGHRRKLWLARRQEE